MLSMSLELDLEERRVSKGLKIAYLLPWLLRPGVVGGSGDFPGNVEGIQG